MSSITFESSLANVSAMQLDSNIGNTCATSSVNQQMMMHNYTNAGSMFPPSQQNQKHISPLAYSTSMACSTGGESSTTSSVSSSHTRLQEFVNPEITMGDRLYNPHTNLPLENYKGEELEGLEPMSRDRSNTWPLRRPTIETQTSPLIHEQIPEEDSLYGSDENLADQQQSSQQQTQQFNQTLTFSNNHQTSCDEENDQFGDDLSPGGDNDMGENTPGSSKKSTTRRNAWGNLSYADLITQAILSSPDQRLTLSQVYEFMISNIPYFSDKGESNSSAGWKNSIRHNLSLHNRFMRIQNEGAGKSSWWVINPDAKSGRNPRRRAATMESSTKIAIDKKRRGARKRLEVGSIRGSTQGLDSVTGSQLSMASQDLFNEAEDGLGPNFDRFRARTQSNLSMPGGNSPHFEDYEYPSWGNTNADVSLGSQLGPIATNVNEIMNRTDQMRLDNESSTPDFCAPSLKDTLQQHQSPLQMQIQQMKKEEIKQEPIVIQQPPSYHEVIQNQGQLRPMMNIPQPMMNIQQPKMMQGNGPTVPQFYPTSVYNMPSQMINQPNLINGQSPMNNPLPMGNPPPMSQQQAPWLQMQPHPQQQMIYRQGQQFVGQLPNNPVMMMGNGRVGPMTSQQQPLPSINDLGQTELPNDLASLSNLDLRFMDADIESIMRTL